LTILLTITLMAMAGLTGYYLGKGKIEIVRRMTDEDSKTALEAQLEVVKKQNDAVDEYNKQHQAVFGNSPYETED